jgi:hypothetical protein
MGRTPDAAERARQLKAGILLADATRKEMVMTRPRTPQHEAQPGRELRASGPGARDEMPAVANDSSRDDLDGQLGPDELPDATEVLLNREAKQHRG